MSMYIPDLWSIVKVNSADPHYRVLGSWYGGFTGSDSWRLNSGIVKCVINEDGRYDFYGSSGSAYVCGTENYGMNSYTKSVIRQYVEDKVFEVLEEGQDWPNYDWIIKC